MVSTERFPVAGAVPGCERRAKIHPMSYFLPGAIFDLDHPAHTMNWQFIHLSDANVVVIALMLVVVFVLAIALPFPGRARRRGGAS